MPEAIETKTADVLVVEDSSTQSLILERLLTGNGYQVNVVRNGAEALDKLEEWLPDLVISDVIMPEMDGYELCKRIKDDERTRSIPVLLLTALREPEDIIRGLMSGADNFITKPYEDDQLLSRVSYVLVNQEIRMNSTAEVGLEIFFAGKRQHIGAERIQILDLLLTTYEEALEQKRALERVNSELRNALATIKTLKGIIPICANCKKIRDDQGYWNRLEEYIGRHSDADFSHGICPDCAHELYPEHFPDR